MWFIGVEVEQETSAPPPKKNPSSAPGVGIFGRCILTSIQRGFVATSQLPNCKNIKLETSSIFVPSLEKKI